MSRINPWVCWDFQDSGAGGAAGWDGRCPCGWMDVTSSFWPGPSGCWDGLFCLLRLEQVPERFCHTQMLCLRAARGLWLPRPLPPLLHPGNPHGAFREQSRKQAGRNRALQPGTGGVRGNLCLIVLFMKLWEGFPVGFLMNWFVVDASNYSANGGSGLIFFPTSFQPPTIKHTNYAVWAFPPSSPRSLTPYLLTELLPFVFQECTWTGWVEGKGNWSPKLFFLSCWISVAHL